MGRHRSGFTLIETVIAIVILSLAVPPMLWAVAESHHERVNPMLASKARWLAVEKLEDVIADRHSQSGNRGYSYLADANYLAEAKGDITGYPQFSRVVSFNETDATLSAPGTGYMTVTVTVGWTDADANAQTLEISTVLTDYTP